MNPQTRLSAFKIMNNVIEISLVEPHNELRFATEFCHSMAAAKINFIFFACCRQAQGWGLDIAVDEADGEKVTDLIQGLFPGTPFRAARSGILSLFPHRSNPTVAGSLFHILEMSGITAQALAYSTSAISVVLDEASIETTTSALFEPFQFSVYRTPADWKLAQQGKEQLFKEVVASYQEKKPKVYGLQWQESQDLFIVEMKNHDIRLMGDAFIHFAGKDVPLPFLTSSPTLNQSELQLFICLPETDSENYQDQFREFLPDSVIAKIGPVGVFSLSGPHFGDRYGIADELLQAFEKARVDLLALGCAVASLTGVVPSDQVGRATDAISASFDVPAVVRKK